MSRRVRVQWWCEEKLSDEQVRAVEDVAKKCRTLVVIFQALLDQKVATSELLHVYLDPSEKQWVVSLGMTIRKTEDGEPERDVDLVRSAWLSSFEGALASFEAALDRKSRRIAASMGR